jgi:hypothetical protein
MLKDKEELKNNVIFHNTILTPGKSYFKYVSPKVEEYVSKMRDSHNYYASNRRTTSAKAAEDDRCGKISEVFVDAFLTNHYGLPGNGVDYEIRKSKNKGWDSDLNYPSVSESYAVKSCFKKYDNEFSWVFQVSNANNFAGKDPIVCRDSSEVCFYVINPESNNIKVTSKIYIVASAPMFMIYDLLREPILRKYKGLKLCLYFNDLKNKFKKQNFVSL